MNGVGSSPIDQRPPDIDGARTVGQLVADASREMSTLVRSEVELAKAGAVSYTHLTLPPSDLG